jgi:hypothetical protein
MYGKIYFGQIPSGISFVSGTPKLCVGIKESHLGIEIILLSSARMIKEIKQWKK